MRFTEKNEIFGYVLPNQNIFGDIMASEIMLSNGNNNIATKNFFGEAIRHFGLIEDVLEKHKVESVEELDLILQGLKDVHQENANLKNELAEIGGKDE